MVSRYLHVTGIVGILDSNELSLLLVLEDDITLLGIGEVLHGMSSLELSISTSSVGEVSEGGEVHEHELLLLVLEFSWDEGNLSTVGVVLDDVVS